MTTSINPLLPVSVARTVQAVQGAHLPETGAGAGHLAICSIDELPGHRDRAVAHVLSLLDPERAEPESFAAYGPHRRVVMRFHDIIEELPGRIAPSRQHMEDILAFGRDMNAAIPDTADATTAAAAVLVHCHMGVSRSTAAMLTLMAQAEPDLDGAELFERLRAIRPIAWPNSRMIGFTDELLGRGGDLVAALRQHYRWQLDRDPDYDDWMVSLGRGAEIDFAYGR